MNARGLGKAVAEGNERDGWLLLLPDGEVRGAATRRNAERIIKAWARVQTGGDESTVLEIEWRKAGEA